MLRLFYVELRCCREISLLLNGMVGNKRHQRCFFYSSVETCDEIEWLENNAFQITLSVSVSGCFAIEDTRIVKIKQLPEIIMKGNILRWIPCAYGYFSKQARVIVF